MDFDSGCLKPEKFVEFLLQNMSPATEVRGLDVWDMEIQVAEEEGKILKVAEVSQKDPKGNS